jgi:predicted alpha/beta superfamily hydrolase
VTHNQIPLERRAYKFTRLQIHESAVVFLKDQLGAINLGTIKQKPASKRQFIVTSVAGLVAMGASQQAQAQSAAQAAPPVTTYSPIIRLKLATSLPLDKSIYISGSFNQWGLGTKAWPMTILPDGSYAARLPTWVRGNYEFKFHLGGWESEAVTARGSKLGNLNHTFSARKPVFETVIDGWTGITAWPKAGSTAPIGVSIFSDDMAMPQLSRNRRIWVYLPPDYGKTAKRYPVIYMHDGQNVFDKATSFVGEWGVDETLNRLAGAGDAGAIVIAIDNGGRNRDEEYHPIHPDTGRPGKADAYLDFIVTTLKPLVDSVFATKPDRLNTAILGASSGGSISLYGALKYPDVFGKAALFSTPLWLEPRFDVMASTINAHRPGAKLWFICGATEKVGTGAAGMFAKDQPALIDALAAAGFSRTTQLSASIDPTGQHGEAFWGPKFEEAYKWLFAT